MLGILGIFLNRKNIIVILMSVELILLSVNLNLVAFSAQLGDLTGQVFAMLILTVLWIVTRWTGVHASRDSDEPPA